MESPYPDLQWRFHSEHYVYIVDSTFYSMTHYDITIGNTVARDVHCDIIMDHDAVMGTYHVAMNTDVARTFLYYVLLLPIMRFLFS